LSGAPAGGATLRSDRRAAGMTSREHTVKRAHTHAQTYEAAAAAADSHNGVPPTGPFGDGYSCAAAGVAAGGTKKRTRRAHGAPHILQFAFCPSAGHKCQLSFRSLITRLPPDDDVATRSLRDHRRRRRPAPPPL